MKKVIKTLVIFGVIIILTGCSGNYTLKINKNLSLDESLSLTIPNENDAYHKTLKIFQDNKIDKDKYKVVIESNEVNINYKEKYSSIEEYILYSKVYHQLFNKIQLNKNRDYVDIYTKEFINQNKNNIYGNNLTNLDYIQVKIQNPFKVKLTNADSINENEYTWDITNEDTEKLIYMQFKPTNEKFPYRSLIVGLMITIISTIFIIIRFKKYKDSQRI